MSASLPEQPSTAIDPAAAVVTKGIVEEGALSSHSQQPQQKWVLLDFGGVILTMKDKSTYRDRMTDVMDAIGFPSSDPSELKKRVYKGPEFAEAKLGKISSHEMWRRIFTNPSLERGSASPSEKCSEEVTPDCASLPPASASSAAGGAFNDASQSEVSPSKSPSRAPMDDATVERFRDYVRLEGRHVDPELIKYIRSLKQRGVEVGVLSNYESDLLEVMDHLGIRSEFQLDHIMSSSDMKAAKPNDKAFHIALGRIRTNSMKLSEGELEAIEARRSSFSTNKNSSFRNVASLTSVNSCGALEGQHSSASVPSQSSSSMRLLDGANITSGDITNDSQQQPPSAEGVGYVDVFLNVVFVDDKESNVIAAMKSGIVHSILYKSLDQCIADIEAALAAM